MAKLEVIIGADSSELSAEIAAAEAKIKRLAAQKSVNLKMGIDNTALNRDITQAKGNLMNLKKSVDSTSDSFAKMKKPVQNGGNTLMQFSRIAQDAPFGIMGIGNNITATAESFSYLSASSGGAGNALKAVASSMMGVGGILLAVSLVTSALTYMSQNGITVGDVFKKLTGNFDAVAAAMKKASDEGIKSSAEEISNLKQLISVAQNETLSREARLAAVNKLQDVYPGHLGNLSKEKILTGDLTEITKELTKALINKAVAQKLTENAVEPTLRLYKANALLIQQKKTEEIAQNNLNKAIENGASGQTLATYSNFLNRSKDNLKDTRDVIKTTTGELTRLEQTINVLAAKSSKLLIEPTKTTKTPKAAKTNKIQALAPLVSIDNEKIKAEGAKVIKLFEDSLGSELDRFKSTKIDLDIPLQPFIAPDAFDGIKAALIDFNDMASDIIQNSVAETFSGLGDAIGSALATGGNVLEAAGKGLLSSLGGVLTDLGKMAIQVGVGLLGIKLALKTLNPVVAIAAGVALVALGGFVSSKSSSIGSSIGGGGGGGSSSVSTGGSYSAPSGGSYSSSNSSGGGSVVFEISGQSLIGVLSNTMDKNSRLGGSLSMGN